MVAVMALEKLNEVDVNRVITYTRQQRSFKLGLAKKRERALVKAIRHVLAIRMKPHTGDYSAGYNDALREVQILLIDAEL